MCTSPSWTSSASSSRALATAPGLFLRSDDMTMDRRNFLSGLAVLGFVGAARANEKLTDRVTLITGVPGNVVALSSNDGVLLVDSGSASSAHAVKASLGRARVHTLFNTHYHSDQTGGN